MKTILKRILDNIPDKYDKGENQFPYDFSKATAIEFANKDKDLEKVKEKLDVDNLHSEDLDRYVSQRTGLIRHPATYSTTDTVKITGQEGATISKGDLVASDTVNFISQEDKQIGSSGEMFVEVECELEGSVGNVPVGAIRHFPVTIPGLVSVTNKNPVTNGYDAESDESLLERYYQRIRTPATSGNKHHYLNWAKEVVGVGDARIVPLWDGPGTVKVILVNANKEPANESLIDDVYNHIEEERPIGSEVTVVSAIVKDIDVKSKVSIANGYTIQGIQAEFIRKLEEYRKDIAFQDSYLSYAAIGNILFNVAGVLDYSDLKLNDGIVNIGLADDEVLIFDSIELEVM